MTDRQARDPDARWRRVCADLLAGVPPTEGLPTDDEVDGCLAVAREEGVAALLSHLLAATRIDLPQALRDGLHEEARLQVMRDLARTMTTRESVAALADAGLEVLLLKGTALAQWLYAAPHLRPGSDVDVLVADMAAAERAVDRLHALGYRLLGGVRPTQSSDYEVALLDDTRRSLVVDLHWQLANHAALARGWTFAELRGEAFPLPALHPRAMALGQVHALVHALMHRQSNLPSGSHDRLVWLYDLHLLAGHFTDADWQDFLRVCREKDLARACLDGLQASRRWLRTAIPGNVEAALLQQTESQSARTTLAGDQGAMDRAHLRALRGRARWIWLWRKLLPPPAFMRHRYEVDGAWTLLGAYLRRWGTGLRRALGG